MVDSNRILKKGNLYSIAKAERQGQKGLCFFCFLKIRVKQILLQIYLPKLTSYNHSQHTGG